MRALLVVFLCIAPSFAHAASGPGLIPQIGPYPVGMRVVQQYDHARGMEQAVNAVGELARRAGSRPVQTLLWYPAKAGGMSMKAIDYELTALSDNDFSVTGAAIAKERDALLRSEDRALFNAPMLAMRDAVMARGRYPVVIYAPSYRARAHENADLCEYLASHGYIVIASPSTGPRGADMSDDVEGLEAQAADITFLVAFAHSLPHADSSRLAVVGFSWGGVANVLAAASSNKVKALVSLDGSARSHTELFTRSRTIAPARTAMPLLWIGSRPMPADPRFEQGRAVATDYFKGMHYSDVYLATLAPMLHMDFSSWALRFDGEARSTNDSRVDVTSAYRWSLRYVKAFLDAYLRQDRGALAFLHDQPSKNGVPAQMMALEIRPASVPLLTAESFVTTFVAHGFTDAEAIYTAMRAQSPEFALRPLQLYTWGGELMARKHAQGAVELFKLAGFINPRYGDTFDSLGQAYEALGETGLAIRAYEQALSADPRLAYPSTRLQELRKP
jgi:dienelactone hydrolase